MHETFGAEAFRKYLTGGDLFFDTDRSLFSAMGDRWMGLGVLLRPSTYVNAIRGWWKGFSGNLKGEGRLLGGVWVIGPGDQGILYEYREEIPGDHPPNEEVLAACLRMNKPAAAAAAAEKKEL